MEAQLNDATSKDPKFKLVAEYIKNGWPPHKHLAQAEVREFWKVKDDLWMQDGIMYKENKIVVPKDLHPDLLSIIHSAHQGVVACKLKARSGLYWPGMSKDIENYVLTCNICQSRAKANAHQPLSVHDIPELPWEKVGTDFLKIENDTYLLVIDYHSKYVELQHLRTTASGPVIQALKAIFARHGIPVVVFSDNGPPYDSKEMQQFYTGWGITGKTSSPKYPRSNGMVERHIQTVKNLLIKAKADNKDLYSALLEYRASATATLPSPSEMLMGRKLRTTLPISRSDLKPRFPIEETYTKLAKRQETMLKYGNQRIKPLSKFVLGQAVWHRIKNREWQPAVIKSFGTTNHCYWIRTPDGATYRRNREQLRPRKVQEPSCPHASQVQHDNGPTQQRNLVTTFENELAPGSLSSNNDEVSQNSSTPIPSPVKNKSSSPLQSVSHYTENPIIGKTADTTAIIPATPRRSPLQAVTSYRESNGFRTRCGRPVRLPKRYQE